MSEQLEREQTGFANNSTSGESVHQEVKQLRAEIAEIRDLLVNITKRPKGFARFRPSLRTIFVTTALIACGLSWMVYETKRSKQVEAAAEQLARLGANVATKPSDRLFVSLLPGRPASPPVSLQVVLGRELFVEPSSLTLNRRTNNPLSQDEQKSLLKALSKIDSLSSLRLYGIELSAADLDSIWQMTDLQSLVIPHSRLSRGPLKGISNLPLQSLDVSHTLFDDSAINSLIKCQDLRTINLDRTAVTGAGLMALSGLPNLTVLKIRRCDISLTTVQEFSKQMPNCFIEYEPLLFDSSGNVNNRLSSTLRVQFGPKQRGSYNPNPALGVWGNLRSF